MRDESRYLRGSSASSIRCGTKIAPLYLVDHPLANIYYADIYALQQ